MIALDNGPADGDYVRYIEGLVAATRTAPTATGTAAGPVLSSPTFVPMPNMPNRPTASGRVAAARITPAAANAIAQAMIHRTSLPTPAGDTAIPRGVAGVLIGLVLLAFGFFSEPVRGFLVLSGILALGLGARTLTRAVASRTS